ncbi:hypothetical protein GMA19_03376 [Paenibacillus polymyxa E681]|nr:hypothetical protein PPE_06135 [Paenibacillus polymyxa E681]QNV58205.1 hypothetical protein GE561_03378 [Paenibacillus polymyxa E681]QNV63040.1 hypothetical protein GMA19_03376 [Paenibacillus polymyxa E681]
MEIQQKWVALNKKVPFICGLRLSPSGFPEVNEKVKSDLGVVLVKEEFMKLEECKWVGSMELKSQRLRILKR